MSLYVYSGRGLVDLHALKVVVLGLSVFGSLDIYYFAALRELECEHAIYIGLIGVGRLSS